MPRKITKYSKKRLNGGRKRLPRNRTAGILSKKSHSRPRTPRSRTSSIRTPTPPTGTRRIRTPTPPREHLTDSEIQHIMYMEGIVTDDGSPADYFDEEDVIEVRTALHGLKYDPEYVLTFSDDTGSLSRLGEQARDKVIDWQRSRDPIV